MTIGLALAGAPAPARADFEMPAQIPTAKLVQQVGFTEIAVEYDCPAVRGRKIWGGLVPYDRPWTIASGPGARIRFTKDVTFGDRPVAAGIYWLVATPTKGAWTVMLDRRVEATASAVGDAHDLEVARVKVQPKASPRRERLTFLFGELGDDHASLDLEWDALRVSIPIRVNTAEQVLSAIKDLDDAWRSFANAARYMLEVKKDYDAGLKYIDQSLALREDWYSVWIKAALLAGKGRFADAHDLAERAHALALKAGNGASLEPDLVAAIATWKRKRQELGQTSSSALAKVGPPPAFGPAAAANDRPPSPPAFAPDGAPAKSAPPGDPPPLRRARLRHK
jgi:hypothetical protein